MIPSKCRRLREAWSDAFDGRGSVRIDHESHLAVCPDCRAFTAAATAARTGLGRLPLPAADPARDAAVLSAFRYRVPVGGASPAHRFTWGWLLRSAGARTAAAGIASFTITLIVAQALTHSPAARLGHPPREASRPAGAAPTGYLVNRIELYTGRMSETRPAPRNRPPVGPPPGSDRKTPAGKGDTEDRARLRSLLSPLG